VKAELWYGEPTSWIVLVKSLQQAEWKMVVAGIDQIGQALKTFREMIGDQDRDDSSGPSSRLSAVNAFLNRGSKSSSWEVLLGS
jgi:hypothetical protein